MRPLSRRAGSKGKFLQTALKTPHNTTVFTI
jgi:hypothetical protein